MNNNHKLVPCGKKERNWHDRPSSNTFRDKQGNIVDMPPTTAKGVHFYLLELEHENECIVFRVGDTVLHDAIALNWDGLPPNERGMAPRGKLIDDSFASQILNEAIRVNPEQADKLNSYRAQING
jgi:hypothetical protein